MHKFLFKKLKKEKYTTKKNERMGEDLTGGAKEMLKHTEIEGIRKWKSFVLRVAD
jgi:hypothetical protein